MSQRDWFMKKRNQRKDETDKSSVLIEPPKLEGNSAGGNHLL